MSAIIWAVKFGNWDVECILDSTLYWQIFNIKWLDFACCIKKKKLWLDVPNALLGVPGCVWWRRFWDGLQRTTLGPCSSETRLPSWQEHRFSSALALWEDCPPLWNVPVWCQLAGITQCSATFLFFIWGWGVIKVCDKNHFEIFSLTDFTALQAKALRWWGCGQGIQAPLHPSASVCAPI